MQQYSLGRRMNNILISIRATFRLLRIALHFVGGASTIIFIYPLVSRSKHLELKRLWSIRALKMLGVKLQVTGQIAANMKVANHISWLDIIAINSVVPSVFIAKDDVRNWPFIGWIATNVETYFMQRGSSKAAHKALQHIADLLNANIDVVAFPEGTSSDGKQILPFYGALLQGPIVAKVAIQPIAISYSDGSGNSSQAPAYYGEIGIFRSLWNLTRADCTIVHLDLLPAINSSTHDRRTLAIALRASIVEHLNL